MDLLFLLWYGFIEFSTSNHKAWQLRQATSNHCIVLSQPVNCFHFIYIKPGKWILYIISKFRQFNRRKIFKKSMNMHLDMKQISWTLGNLPNAFFSTLSTYSLEFQYSLSTPMLDQFHTTKSNLVWIKLNWNSWIFNSFRQIEISNFHSPQAKTDLNSALIQIIQFWTFQNH